MIRVLCYNCGSNNETPYATENGWRLVKCAGCGLLYVNPRPGDNEIEEGQQIGIHQGQRPLESNSKRMPLKVPLYHKILSDIYGSTLGNKEVSWLDVGCGYGELIEALKRLTIKNLSAKGLELNLY